MAITSIKTGSSFTNLQKYNDFLGPNSAYNPTSFESIATVTVSSSVASVDFTSIPGTYTSLQLRGIAKITAAGYPKTIRARFNSDSGTNYTSHMIYGDGTNVTASGPIGTSFMQIARAGAAGSSSANVFGAFIIDLHDYASTTKYKTVRSFNGINANAGGGEVALNSNLWMSTSAITSISFILDSANFDVGTTISLYGIKGA